MKILALEFSSPQRSVAVLTENPAAVGEVIEAAPGYGMKPFAMIESALRQTGLEREQIECIAVGLGPGSYNGIRAAIALAQGWQLATGVKLIGISSAACLAALAPAEFHDQLPEKFSVVINAQREEFYVAGYANDAGEWREVAPLRLATFAEVRELAAAGEMLIGPEVTRWFPHGRIAFPRAAGLGRLVLDRKDFVAGEKLEPIYLRETSFVKAPPARVRPMAHPGSANSLVDESGLA